MIGDALKYPFAGTGRYMLVIGGLLSLFVSGGAYLPLLGFIIGIGASGYFTAYMFKIINTTACGYDEPCDWPEFSNVFDDLFMPWLCMASAFFFSFGPCILARIISGWWTFLPVALLILGFAHLPMAILSVALSGTPKTAFWTTTVPQILNCLPQYLVLVLLMGGLSFLGWLLNVVLEEIPILGWFVSFFLGMYSLMVSGRIIGLFVRENRQLI